MDGRQAQRMRFDAFEFVPATGELWRAGEPVKLQPQPARLLAVLLEQPGRVVTREGLRERLWPDRIVEFDQGLNFAVAQVRRALDDDPTAPRYIETVPKVGYRFIAEVEPVDAAGGGEDGEEPRMSRRRGLLLAALVLVSIALAGTMLSGRNDPQELLLVLPFEPLGTEPPDPAFVRGLMEDLITELAGLDPARLGVIAPTTALRVAADPVGPDSVASVLGADYVLSGAVRGGAERVRINAHLRRASDGRVLWSRGFDRTASSALSVQGDVAEQVAAALPVRPERSARDAGLPGAPRIDDPAARDAYVAARYLIDRGDSAALARARVELERAAAAAPGSAPVEALRAELFWRLGEVDPAHVAARRAVALDPADPRGHRQLARVLIDHEWDVEGAGRHYRRAVELAPGVALYHAVYAAYFGATGQHDRATRRLSRALALDPLSPVKLRDLGWSYTYSDTPLEAVPVCRRQGELDPRSPGWAHCLYRAFDVAEMPDSAATYALEHMRLHGADTLRIRRVERARDPGTRLARYLDWRLERARQRFARDEASAYDMGVAHARVGHRDSAFHYLDRAFAERDWWLIYARYEPWLDPLRTDPRFAALSRRVDATLERAEARGRQGGT